MTSATSVQRGQIYRVDFGADVGYQPVLVVSNTMRNRNPDDFLGVRITTTSKNLPTFVPLRNECIQGFVCCDALQDFYHDEVANYLGALSRTTMQEVEKGLMVALGIES